MCQRVPPQQSKGFQTNSLTNGLANRALTRAMVGRTARAVKLSHEGKKQSKQVCNELLSQIDGQADSGLCGLTLSL